MCRADNDVMFRPGFNANKMEVYEYVLVYSDDFLLVALDPKSIIDMINGKFNIKEGSTGQPTQYLGASITKYQVEDGSWAWSMSSDQYVKAALENIKSYQKLKEQFLKTKTACVLPSGWKPELDTTNLLEDEDACFYQSQIGVLRWAVELGRIDIATEVSMLAAYSVAP
jgi:hypothetical protein